MTNRLQTPKYHPPRLAPAHIRLLERLCNACAISGDEGEVRTIVLEQARGYLKTSGHPGDIKIDALGNVLVTLPGKTNGDIPRPRVMLAAHMDEVGFMITNDDGKGIFRFEIVGGIDLRQLPGKPVWVGEKHIPGVIGVKPIHLTRDEEIKKLIDLDTLRIDVGPGSNHVKVGDRATFASSFTRLGPSLRAKALDDRLGIAILIELIKTAPDNIDLLAAFTVQEEVGARGARVAAYTFNPDLAIAIDSTPAYDLPTWDGSENVIYNCRLGAGPAIYLADSATLADPRLVHHMVDTAESLGIAYQIRQPGSGGTDAGAIHRQRAGIPSISVSVPGRYHHSSASISRLSDWQNTFGLLQAALACLPADLLSRDREQ